MKTKTVEDALDEWWSENHFGDQCEIGGAAHSEKCVSDAFKDGYSAGRLRSVPELLVASSKAIADLQTSPKNKIAWAWLAGDEAIWKPRAFGPYNVILHKVRQIIWLVEFKNSPKAFANADESELERAHDA